MKTHFSRALNRWLADYRIGPRGDKSRRIRRFKSKAQLDAHVAEVTGNMTRAKSVLLAMAPDEQAEVVELLDEATEGGFTIREAVRAFRESGKVKPRVFTVKECYEDFLAEKQRMSLSDRWIKSIRSNVGRFAALNPDRSIKEVTRESVMAWLQNPEWGPRTFNSYLINLQAFFTWCVGCKRLTESPASTIRQIRRSQMPDIDKPPAVLNDDQLERYLIAAYYHDPAMLRPIVLGAFAGLRPIREATKTHKDDYQDGLLLVRGAHAKDRNRRYVDLTPTLKAWLDLCPPIKPLKNTRRREALLRQMAGLVRVKLVKGKQRIRPNKHGTGMKKDGCPTRPLITWTGWGQDVLRHTFASNYLPVHGVQKTVEQLGHGDYDLLFGHYRHLRSKAAAEAFWKRFEALALSLSQAS